MEHSENQLSDLRALEHPTLKVPYEVLNKKFRSAQKVIDRETSHIQTSLAEIEKNINKKHYHELSEIIGGMVDKLNILKRKAEESVGEEQLAASVCKRRLDHLMECSGIASPEVSSLWKKKRLDRMLVDHFLRSGYYKSALQLAKHSGIEDLTNIDLFLVSKEVEESLANKETAKCLMWCYENKSKLRKLKSSLEFKLRQQEFVELIKNDKRLEAVKHARKYFANLEEDHLKEVQHVMALLAYPTPMENSPYKALLDDERWNDLIQQFRQENFKLYQLSSLSVFSVTLQAGLSSLKTPHCYRSGEERHPECPVCSPVLNRLASSLPYAHCSQSRLICLISGAPLNEHNPPLMLPNGYVYGEQALKKMASENNGKVVCPRTKEAFDIKQAEKVFVM